jgi:hypothetical protein
LRAPPKTSEDRRRILEDIQKNGGDIWAGQFLGWLGDAARVTEAVAAMASQALRHADTIAVFWIRTYGVLTDVRRAMERQRGTLVQLDGDLMPYARRTYLEPLNRIIELIEDIRAAFDTDELLWLEYRRNVECHPWQDKYRLRTKRDGSLDDERHHELLQGRRVVEDTQAALSRVVRRYNIDEDGIAIDFAKRIAAPLRELSNFAHRWNSRPIGHRDDGGR